MTDEILTGKAVVTPSGSLAIDTSAFAMERRPARLAPALPNIDLTPTQMVAVAVQRGEAIEYIKQLMDLQDRWERGQARKAFEAAVSAAKAEIKPIMKNASVDFANKSSTASTARTAYKYADFAQIAREVDPILAKYGLSYRHRPKQEGKMVTITCILSHRDGYQEESSLSAMNDESGNKNSIQAVASTATYLQRYTLNLALGLSASKDDDGRGAGVAGETISEEQVANLKAVLTEAGANMESYLVWARASSLEEILVKDYKNCMAMAERKRAKQ